MKKPKHLSNKIKREAFINSFPLKKIAKKYLLWAAKDYIKMCLKLAEHPRRKNFPVYSYIFMRKINNEIWEVIKVQVRYDKNTGVSFDRPGLLLRWYLPFDTFYNNSTGFQYNRYPRWNIDVRESKKPYDLLINRMNIIPTKYIPQYGYISDKQIFEADKSLIEAPLFETTIKTKSKKFLELFKKAEYEQNTYLKVFSFLKSKQELNDFETFIEKTDIILNSFSDFVRMARKRKDPLFIDNWSEKHDEYIKIDLDLKQAQERIIEKRLKEMKKTLFKTKPNKIKYRFFKPQTQEDLKKIGEEMSICVGSGFFPKEIVLAKLNNYKVCIQLREDRFLQIYTYKNNKIPINIENKLRKEVLKWRNTNI